MAAWSKRTQARERQVVRSPTAQSPTRQAMSADEALQLEAAVASKLGPEQAALMEAEGGSRARLVRPPLEPRWPAPHASANLFCPLREANGLWVGASH